MSEITWAIFFLAGITAMLALLRWMDRTDARLKALENAAKPQEKP
jgi:hypothetical protein